MDIPELKVEARKETGKGPMAILRRAGQIPAVCYGKGLEPLPVSLDPEALMQILRGPRGLNSLIRLDGAEGRTVFVQEIQRHPVSRDVLHVDFIHVDTEQTVRRHVPVEFVGKPEGVKLGGVLQITRREILVESLPALIPESITINVEPLLIGHSVHVEEIELPEGARAIFERNFSICAVVAPTEEKVEEEVPAEAEAEGEAPAEGAPADAKPGEEKKEEGEKKEEAPDKDKK
jgi:large subunit ribosomal protein L25